MTGEYLDLLHSSKYEIVVIFDTPPLNLSSGYQVSVLEMHGK